MPELVEVERYRALAAVVVGFRVATVDAPDAQVPRAAGLEPTEVRRLHRQLRATRATVGGRTTWWCPAHQR